MITESPLLTRIRKNSKDKGYQGRIAETTLTQRLGGRAQPGSGAVAGAKSDCKLNTTKYQFLIENKSSTNKSFSVQRDQLFKVYQEALEVTRIPALSFQFVDQQGKSEKRERWVCIPEHIFQLIIEGEEV
jgi:hypothetical protein